MIMKILVLTTIYKDIDDPTDAATTPVVHNFAKEWVAAGHEVILVHNFNIFPKILYYVPQLIWDKLSAKKGFRTILSLNQTFDVSYERDGVKVYRSTIKKPMPLCSYTEGELKRSIEKIHKILQDNNFTPDLIVAHMENPQLFQLAQLKSIYPKAKTSLVFHQIDYLHKPKYDKWKVEYLPLIDKVGFRSKEAYREASRLIGFNRDDYFMCPSGISDKFIESEPPYDSKFTDYKLRILYVGTFTPRKHVETIICAVNQILKITKVDITVNLIGGGLLEEDMKKLVRELGMTNVVNFRGRMAHDKVLEMMRESDVFIMVSEREVFGLVYTEAMSQGCVVIASERGGMEGIVQDGVNGYMSTAGDVNSLVDKLQTIIHQGRDRNIAVSKESYKTAMKYTEKAVAEQYLKSIMKE